MQSVASAILRAKTWTNTGHQAQGLHAIPRMSQDIVGNQDRYQSLYCVYGADDTPLAAPLQYHTPPSTCRQFLLVRQSWLYR